MKTKTEKVVWEGQVNCPWCRKRIRTKVFRTTITPGVKAKTVLEGSFEKDTQTTLEQDYKAAWNPEKKRGRPRRGS